MPPFFSEQSTQKILLQSKPLTSPFYLILNNSNKRLKSISNFGLKKELITLYLAHPIVMMVQNIINMYHVDFMYIHTYAYNS